jgi:hypothetical protein
MSTFQPDPVFEPQFVAAAAEPGNETASTLRSIGTTNHVIRGRIAAPYTEADRHLGVWIRTKSSAVWRIRVRVDAIWAELTGRSRTYKLRS